MSAPQFTTQRKTIAALGLSLLAVGLICWQLAGLRFTNHDDIYWHLASHAYPDHWGYALKVAFNQARLQALVNLPIALWIEGLQESPWLDVLNLMSVLLLYAAVATFVSTLVGLREGLCVVAAAALLFPLHFYFTFPQGYPVMWTWGLACALIAATLLHSHLRSPAIWKIALSALLFLVSLWGSEYNFVLHPALLIIVFAAQGWPGWKIGYWTRKAWPYALAWIGTIGAYLIFSMYARQGAADADGRVTMSLDPAAWAETFLRLEVKSWLPAGLIHGITLINDYPLGGVETPQVLKYTTLATAFADGTSTAIIFLLFLLAFIALLRLQDLRFESVRVRALAAALASLAVIPCAVLALSSHYQNIVNSGHIQGHMATFMAQLGLSGLAFVVLACLYNRVAPKRRLAVLLCAASLLALIGTFTIIYNNANRQLMMANVQKWQAMQQLATYIHAERKDLKKREVSVPSLWLRIGVSQMPPIMANRNYWGEYTRILLKKKLTIVRGPPEPGAVFAKHFATPEGTALVAMNDALGRTTLLAARPVTGTFTYKQDGVPKTYVVNASHWKCARQCVAEVDIPREVMHLSLFFKAEDPGRRRLVSQFFMPRSEGYAQPLLRRRDAE